MRKSIVRILTTAIFGVVGSVLILGYQKIKSRLSVDKERFGTVEGKEVDL